MGSEISSSPLAVGENRHRRGTGDHRVDPCLWSVWPLKSGRSPSTLMKFDLTGAGKEGTKGGGGSTFLEKFAYPPSRPHSRRFWGGARPRGSFPVPPRRRPAHAPRP